MLGDVLLALGGSCGPVISGGLFGVDDDAFVGGGSAQRIESIAASGEVFDTVGGSSSFSGRA